MKVQTSVPMRGEVNANGLAIEGTGWNFYHVPILMHQQCITKQGAKVDLRHGGQICDHAGIQQSTSSDGSCSRYDRQQYQQVALCMWEYCWITRGNENPSTTLGWFYHEIVACQQTVSS